MDRRKVELRQATNGQWYFCLVYGNGEDGPVSETYTRKSNAKRAALRTYPGVDVVVEDTV